MTLRTAEYVTAARALGVTEASINFRRLLLVSIFLTLLVLSCKSNSQFENQQTVTPILVSSNSENQDYTCGDIDSNWGKDWSLVILVLDDLIGSEQTCGDEPLLSKKYAAHFNYAVSLEASGEIEAAIENYSAAFLIDANRSEALNALIRLDALPEPTPTPCESKSAQLPDPSTGVLPDDTLFIQVKDGKLLLQGQPYTVRGVNYYPRNAPWHRFLLEAEISEIEMELNLIEQAGFNTVRIFLWYEPLFTCQLEDAIPDEQLFQKVDALIQLANKRDLRLIVTLNDLPDLIFRPLYTNWERYDAQTTYIVRRYQNEPAILAWDLRNEGDLDYGARFGDKVMFEKEIVLNWLDHTSNLVRENDPYHLITAGWWGDPTDTEPYVDFLSFHHWNDTFSLQTRINSYTRNSSKPLLLEEIGYHSWQEALQDMRSEEEQADLLRNAVELAESEAIAGWVIWTAFDFVPEAGHTPNFEHFFGLWRSDLTPKPALSQIFQD